MTWSRQSERKLSPIAKLTSSNRTNSGPTHQNSGGRKSLGFGTAAGATDILDKEPFSRRGGIQKERVIVPWAGRRRLGDKVSGFDAPALDGLASLIFFPPIHRRAQSRTSARLGSSFLDNPGLNSRCFYHFETLKEVFSETRGHPVTIENHQPSGITGGWLPRVSLWQLLIWRSPPLSEMP